VLCTLYVLANLCTEKKLVEKIESMTTPVREKRKIKAKKLRLATLMHVSSHSYDAFFFTLLRVSHHTRTYVSSHSYDACFITPVRTFHHTPMRITSHPYVRLITPLRVSHHTSTYVSSHPYAYLITPVRTSHHTPMRIS